MSRQLIFLGENFVYKLTDSKEIKFSIVDYQQFSV